MCNFSKQKIKQFAIIVSLQCNGKLNDIIKIYKIYL